ncbi:hypothetical protein Tco_0225541, partial [Tanacetum coccineum]
MTLRLVFSPWRGVTVKPIWRKKPSICNSSNVLNTTSPIPKPPTPHHEPSQENNHPNQTLPNLCIKDNFTSPQVVSHPPFPIPPFNSHATHTQAPSQNDNQTPYIKDTPISKQGADKSKISRKQSKTSKPEHENQKSTKPKLQKPKAFAKFPFITFPGTNL